jgi:hypothetical protein
VLQASGSAAPTTRFSSSSLLSSCTFVQSCGGTWNLNNSYWRDSKTRTGADTGDTSPCTFTVCRTDSDIGQIRLDFETFSLSQPNTVTGDDGSKGQGLGESRTQCQLAQFRATSTGPAPVLCGENSGTHMYLEAKADCNTLTMSWLPGTPVATFSIKVSQHSSTAWYRAPPDCTQYMTGTTGYIKSFNYDSGVHLANQNYQICIRAERNMCTVSYAALSPTTFQMSGSTPASGDVQTYGCSEDYITLTGGTNPALPLAPSGPSAKKINRFCGALLTYTVTSTIAATIYTTHMPFRVGVYTDGGEGDSFTAPATYTSQYSLGFKLYYAQTSC